MNDKEIKQKTNEACYKLMKETGIIAPVDVFVMIGVLSKTDYEQWQRGNIDYLERACKANLRKLSVVNREIRIFAKKNELKASRTFYRKRNKASNKANLKNSCHSREELEKSVKLQFSKYGDENIERQYATHFMSQLALDKIKEPLRQTKSSSAYAVENAE